MDRSCGQYRGFRVPRIVYPANLGASLRHLFGCFRRPSRARSVRSNPSSPVRCKHCRSRRYFRCRTACERRGFRQGEKAHSRQSLRQACQNGPFVHGAHCEQPGRANRRRRSRAARGVFRFVPPAVFLCASCTSYAVCLSRAFFFFCRACAARVRASYSRLHSDVSENGETGHAKLLGELS